MFENSARSIDAMESRLLELETMVSRIRSEQLTILAELDVAQVAALDGSRSLVEWTAARMDVTSEAASALVYGSRVAAEHGELAKALGGGSITFDRMVATARLAGAGASPELLAGSAGFDLTGVRRLVAAQRRFTRRGEAEAFRGRYVAMQPTLDETTWRLWGQLPGYEGRVVERALIERADALPQPPAGERTSLGQRSADALVAMAQDSIDGGVADQRGPSATPLVTVFVDAALAGETNGEAGAALAAGPRVGPAVLERILCEGAVQVVAVADGVPVVASAATRTIPPAIRRFVSWRDGGCVADGCRSRNRLQPHHVQERSRGGDHDPKNLRTLCWYHHHVVIHGMGYRIDPDSPPRRIRFLRPGASRAPP